jgi:predicted metal-binding membrane protein
MTELTMAAPAADAPPHSAYAVLERRATLVTVGVLLALATVAWWLTVGTARDMSGMVQGVAQVGSGMPFDMTASVFMSMWLAMMVAMMFPAIAPIVLLHRMVMRRQQQGRAPTVAFGLGYLLVWTLIGLVPLAALVAFRHVADDAGWAPRAGGAVLVVAGAYQFTRWKDVCQRVCRSPLSFLMTHHFGKGSAGALRAGVSHGLYCLGCCWALMAVLFVVGLMNLAWMAAIAVVFVAEKNWRHGVLLTKVVGTAVLVLGLAVLARPQLLASVSVVETHQGDVMTDMDDHAPMDDMGGM